MHLGEEQARVLKASRPAGMRGYVAYRIAKTSIVTNIPIMNMIYIFFA